MPKFQPLRNAIHIKTASHLEQPSGMYNKTKEHQLFQNVLCHSSNVTVKKLRLGQLFEFFFFAYRHFCPKTYPDSLQSRWQNWFDYWRYKFEQTNTQAKVKSRTKSREILCISTMCWWNPFSKVFIMCRVGNSVSLSLFTD